MAKQNKEFPVQSAYRQRLSDMLDLTYELEGLLHIGIGRSMVPPRLNHLIVSKLNAIVALADDEGASETAVEVSPESAHIPEEAPAIEEATEISAAENDEEGPDFSDSSAVSDFSDSSEVSDFSDNSDFSDSSDFPGDAENQEEGYYAEEEEERPIAVKVIDMSEKVQENMNDAASVSAAKLKEEKSAQPSGGRIFSINDRFLYSRELFGGKVADFDEAINTVITMDTPEEAEEYFLSEWDFDIENSTAQEFLEKIKTIF